jgi:hypothetical protein
MVMSTYHIILRRFYHPHPNLLPSREKELLSFSDFRGKASPFIKGENDLLFSPISKEKNFLKLENELKIS